VSANQLLYPLVLELRECSAVISTVIACVGTLIAHQGSFITKQIATQ
jgi:hypothetical protein